MKVEKIMQHLIGKSYQEVSASLNIKSDNGDCCGWAHCDVRDDIALLASNETTILADVIQYTYDDDDAARAVVNFVFNIGGNDGLILGYDMTASSGSGWSYGAYCDLYYGDELVSGVAF